MIVYDLVCTHEHRFEGWFGSSADFTRQRDEELIRCPMCDDAAIERRPSANIHIGRAGEQSPPAMPAERNDAPAAGVTNVADGHEAANSGSHADVLKFLRR